MSRSFTSCRHRSQFSVREPQYSWWSDSSTIGTETSQNSHSTVRMRHASALCRAISERATRAPHSHATSAAGHTAAWASFSVRCTASAHAGHFQTFREQKAMCISRRSSGTSAAQLGQGGIAREDLPQPHGQTRSYHLSSRGGRAAEHQPLGRASQHRESSLFATQ